MSRPSVSVIVPTYNRQRYLERALDSVLAQSLEDWECLIVDDGSTDGTDRLAAELAARDPRISFHRFEHGGVCRTLNRGIRLARGEWIQFLDDDDAVHPDKLRFQLEWAAEHGLPDGPAVLYGDYDVVYEEENGEEPLPTRRETIRVGDLTTEELLLETMRWNFRPDGPLNQGSPLYRRSVFGDLWMDEHMRAFTDTKLQIDVLLAGVPFLYTPIVGFVQYVHGANRTRNAALMRREYFKLMDQVAVRAPALVTECSSFGPLLRQAIRDADWPSIHLMLDILRRSRVPIHLERSGRDVDVTRTLRAAAAVHLPARLLPVVLRGSTAVSRVVGTGLVVLLLACAAGPAGSRGVRTLRILTEARPYPTLTGF